MGRGAWKAKKVEVKGRAGERCALDLVKEAMRGRH